MRLRWGFVTGLLILSGPLGCGGSNTATPKPAAPKATASAAPISPAADARAAQTAVQKWVDDDDCSVLSEDFLEGSYGTTGTDALAACDGDGYEGLRADDYTVASAEVDGDAATVLLDVVDGSERRYEMVRMDDQWLVDNVESTPPAPRAAIGKSLRLFDAYELDGEPLDFRLTVAALSLRDRRAPRYTPTKPGRRWMALRVRAASESSDTIDVASSSFELANADGERYAGEGYPFQPTFGHDVSRLRPEEKLTGYVSFQVPRRFKPTEIRFSSPGSQTDPMVWELTR